MAKRLTQCKCVMQHNPDPVYDQEHHIVPQSWVKAGASPARPETKVAICGTSHDAVHDLLNEYVRHDGEPPWEVRRRYGAFVRDLAERAWAHRPSGKPPMTLSNGEILDG